MVDIRRLIAVILVAGASLLLGIQYLRLVGPATAREIDSACVNMHGSAASKTLRRVSGGITPAPAFTAQDYTGAQVSLADFRGKVVLVNFWASWCSTCSAEKPTLEQLQRDLGDDLVILALASDVEWEPIRKKFPDGTSLKVLLDRPEEEGSIGPIATAYGIKAVPESFLVDKRGMLRHYFVNKRDWSSGIAKTCLRALTNE